MIIFKDFSHQASQRSTSQLGTEQLRNEKPDPPSYDAFKPWWLFYFSLLFPTVYIYKECRVFFQVVKSEIGIIETLTIIFQG